MIWSHTVVFPLAVPPATPMRKGSVRCFLSPPLPLVPGEMPLGEAPSAASSSPRAQFTVSLDARLEDRDDLCRPRAFFWGDSGDDDDGGSLDVTMEAVPNYWSSSVEC